MNYRILLLLIFLSITLRLSAQTSEAQKKADSLYRKGLDLYNQKDTSGAVINLERAVRLMEINKDYVFNLAVIYVQSGRVGDGINLFQKAVKLGDRNAADVLKRQLGQEIECSDTMDIADVKVVPQVQMKQELAPAFTNKGLNSKIERQIIADISRSSIIRSSALSRITLSVYFSKNGFMDAKMLGEPQADIENEVSRILRRIKIVPAKCLDQEVTCGGLTLPIYL